MGLDVSHGAFGGAYSAFDRFRRFVATAAGVSWPPHDDPQLPRDRWIAPDGMTAETHPGLWLFFCASDCDGSFSPEEAGAMAKDLEALKPHAKAALDKMGEPGGHIAREGGFEAVLDRFIAGCRAAEAAGENLEFA